MDRVQIVHDAFVERLRKGGFPATGKPETTPELLISLYRSQCLSRQLDKTARDLQKRGQGYYTIGSSGHEGMAAVASAVRPTDMAFLHYRDAAFQIQRAKQVEPAMTEREIAWDMLLSFSASSEDPISGGRHKVLGSKRLNIPPQTSTIASHLPKAVGAAFALGLSRRLLPGAAQAEREGLVVCSFGDASANHSTAQGAFNTAGWASYQNAPMPILFVCEDNGIGISVRTPAGWIEAGFRARPGLRYFACDGADICAAEEVTRQAAAFVRTARKPAFLHLKTVRLFGHAGSDVEAAYREPGELAADEARDPLLTSAMQLCGAGVLSAGEALAAYTELGDLCAELADKVAARPKLRTGAEVAASLIPPPRPTSARNAPSPEDRAAAFGRDFALMDQPQPMAKLINWCLADLMLEHPEIILAGEDIGRKGGVYGVTRSLQRGFGADRVIDTLLDEQSILGLAIGLGQTGFLPIPEIQFLAYLHNAEDQIRGEAATLPFFSNGQFTNPMVVRVAGLGYQRGFGGHFHNDNSLAVLRDIPGVVIACPSNGADAVRMLRGAVKLAREEQRVVVFVEPIALYQTRDLGAEGDGGWMHAYPEPSEILLPGALGVSGDGKDVAIISYANGCYLSQRASARLAEEGIGTRVIDLRWLAPLAEEALLQEISECASVLIVDECRRTGSQSEALATLVAERTTLPFARVVADDCFIATGPAYAATLPSEDEIVVAARRLKERAA